MAKDIKKLIRKLIIDKKGRRRAVHVLPEKRLKEGSLSKPYFFLKRSERKLNDLEREINQLKTLPVTVERQVELGKKLLQKQDALEQYKRTRNKYANAVHTLPSKPEKPPTPPKPSTPPTAQKPYTHTDHVANYYDQKDY